MRHVIFAISTISLACMSSVYAATPVNLSHQPATFLQSLIAPNLAAASSTLQTSVKQISSDVDFNQTTHIRIQQMVGNYPVWGSDAVVHIAHNNHATLAAVGKDTTMNGTVYQNLTMDLNNTPAYVFNAAQADKALQQAIKQYQNKNGIHQINMNQVKKNLMVYVDKNNKAHWSFLIAFLAESKNMPALPTYIMDATTFAVYEEWDDVQTLEDVKGGGFGGNEKIGKIFYDGTPHNYPALNIQRDPNKHICYMQNADVLVLDDNHKPSPFKDADVEQFQCDKADPQHGNIFWNAGQDAVKGGYSPANDALYIGKVIKEMYQNWYGVPVLAKKGKPLMLKMNVHAKQYGQPIDNAMFLSINNEMYFGDGVKMFYPLTSLSVGAHEISHGFTALHSNLVYKQQSGGLNEAFSDMAAQAAQYYSTGTNTWELGAEIIKGTGSLRYMDDPTKDGRSIASMKDYTDDLNVHFTSGIFNKLFYLIGTAPGWNTKKAFDVMVKANMNYWTSTTTFADAACGVMKAAADYQYDKTAVSQAMTQVGLDASQC